MKIVVAFVLTGLIVLSCVTQLPHAQITSQDISIPLDATLVTKDSLNANTVNRHADGALLYIASYTNS